MSMTVATELTDVDHANQLAAELHALAEFVQRNPELYPYLRYSGLTNDINIPIQPHEQPREAIAAFVRAALRAEHGITKRMSDRWAGATIDFGGQVGLHVYAQREEVCDRVVVGTEEVTESVPDPEALAAVPKVEVTRTVDKVEWHCRSLLAGDERDESEPAGNPLPEGVEGFPVGGRAGAR